MFVNDLFKITENSNEEYYAVYNQRGRPLIMRKPVGKTAEAYAEEKNYRIKGGPFDSHQATESFWIRSVLLGKDKKVDEDTFDDKSPHTSYVQSIRTLTNKDGDENYKHRVASVSTDKSGNQRVRALDTSRDFGDELTIDTIVPKNAKIDIVPQQHFGKYVDTGDLQETFAVGDQPQIDSITKGDEQYWADFDKRAVAQGDARLKLKSTYVDPVDKTIQPTIGRTWQERGVKLDKWSKDTYKHQPEFYQDLDKINAQLAAGQKITDPNLMKLMPSYREVQQTNPKGVPIGKKATYEQSGANAKETEPTTNQPRTRLSAAEREQLRKDIDAVDYNKPRQPPAAPSAEQKAGIRQAVSDYNKDKKVDEAGPFSYGAKKPRKGSVADLAAQKRKEQERGRQPAEPRDQRVGVAKVVKEYGDTAKGQKMLTKVQKRAVDRLIKADDKNRLEPDYTKRDLKTVRKHQATADRAWDRMSDLAEQGVAEAEGQQLSVNQLAMISDEALDNAYGYGRSSPGNTFGWQANLMSAAYAKKMIDAGVTDIEKIADAIHKGWNVTAQKFVQDPYQFDDTEKLRQAGKLDAKLAQRAKLMRIGYFELDNDEQEKDRVVARALLKAIKGEQGVAEGLNEFAPSGGGGGRWYSDDQLYDIIGEDWLEAFDVSGDQGNIDLRGERARLFLAQEAEAWLTDRGYRVNVLDVRDDGDELSWYIQGPLYRGLDEDWKKVNRRDRTPGMSRKAVKAYRRENPGSKLQTAVTTKPSKLKKGSKSAKRRKSFCARMKGMKRAHAGAKTKRNPDSPINKALRRWNCESIEEMRDLVMIAEQRISAMREGGFDIPEIPRAPQPRPQPKEKTSEDASKYMDTKPSSVTAKQASEFDDAAKRAFKPKYYEKDDEPAPKKRDWDYDDPEVKPIVKQWMDKNLIDRKPMTYQHGDEDIDEGSVQDKLHRRHQDLRKKRGAPNPEYYKELKTTFDLPDDERWQKTAELKKKYKVTNEDVEKYLEEMNRAGYEIVTESATLCPECGGAAYADRMLAEKQDACYHKVKSRYKVWPSAYASGALVRCRKKGAANWGNKSKK